MILYHGSNIEIKDIDLSKSKVGKDFGCGFYLSADRGQALELARKKTEQVGFGTPIVNPFEYDEKASEVLNVLTFEAYTKEWAEFVLMNRKNRTRVQAHEYDIVIGPITNDAVGLQIRRLTSGLIDMERFLAELKYMRGVTFQYFFANEKAITCLKRI